MVLYNVSCGGQKPILVTCSELSQLPTLLYPLLWLDESAEINDKGLNTFKDMFFSVKEEITMATYLLLFLGGLILVLTLVYVAVKYRKYKKLEVLALL